MSQVELQNNPNGGEMFRPDGPTLYLTTNPDLIRKQLEGQPLLFALPVELMSEVSTDEIAPNRVCLRYTGHEENLLGNNLLTGLRGGVVRLGEIVNGGFETVVAGPSFGRGSSRYHAQLALLEAGIKLLITEPERIFEENAVNAGIHVLPPESTAAKQLLDGRSVSIHEMKEHLSSVSKDIMTAGSLVTYLRLLQEGQFAYPIPRKAPRPMTMIEKMIAAKTHTSNDSVGVNFVRPGETVIAKPDLMYGYELQTVAMRRALEQEFGDDIPVVNPKNVFLFNEHTALLNTPETQTQRHEQELFANKYAIVNYRNNPDTGAPAICHTKMLEDHALPGQLILGNDSHTDTLGVLNTAAVGKGAADLAGALAFDKMVLKVPETIRVNLAGSLRNGATMKDVMLYLGALPELKEQRIASGRVLEFGGDALNAIDVDEQLKLTNMAIELQAFTGVIEPNQQTFKYLNKMRGMGLQEFCEKMVVSDENAEYFQVLPTINLGDIEPMVATPGDTQNGVRLSEVREQNIQVQKAYIGSCTHGTPEDLRQAAEVMQGRKVADGVKLYVQASSIGNLHASEELGYIQTLLDAGAELLPIGCGACMNAGPGSTEEGEVGIFATNRNYPGRTGKGETYLANPKVVAASAVKGFICGPDDLDAISS